MDRPRRRKLLAASVGVAAVSYVIGVACDNNVTSGNLPAPTPPDAANEQNVISGNLPAPPPVDSGSDASDGGDASDAASGDASDASSD